MGSADGAFARFGKAEKAHLSLLNEIGHGPHDFFDWNFRVHPMLIKQIDTVGAEPAQ